MTDKGILCFLIAMVLCFLLMGARSFYDMYVVHRCLGKTIMESLKQAYKDFFNIH